MCAPLFSSVGELVSIFSSFPSSAETKRKTVRKTENKGNKTQWKNSLNTWLTFNLVLFWFRLSLQTFALHLSRTVPVRLWSLFLLFFLLACIFSLLLLAFISISCLLLFLLLCCNGLYLSFFLFKDRGFFRLIRDFNNLKERRGSHFQIRKNCKCKYNDTAQNWLHCTDNKNRWHGYKSRITSGSSPFLAPLPSSPSFFISSLSSDLDKSSNKTEHTAKWVFISLLELSLNK